MREDPPWTDRQGRLRGMGPRPPAQAAQVELDLAEAVRGKTIDWLGPVRRARVTADRLGRARLLRAWLPPLVISSPGLDGGGGDAPATPPPRDCGDHLHLVVHLEGAAQYRHGGKDGALHRPGSVVLVDATRPCAAAHPAGGQVLVWSLPRTLVAPCPPDLPPVAALDPESAGIVSLLARSLAARGPRLAPDLRRGFVEHFAALVGLAFSCRDTAEARSRAGQASRRRARVRSYLEARFRDPGLTVARAARELGMSRRWLQAQFDAGEGFADALARRRLEAGLSLLRDPAADHLTVTEIAFAVGFNDLSTFHRRFRRRFGLAPGAARRTQARDTLPSLA